MKTQNLIKQTLSRAESIVVVQQILEDNGEASHTAIAASAKQSSSSRTEKAEFVG